MAYPDLVEKPRRKGTNINLTFLGFRPQTSGQNRC